MSRVTMKAERFFLSFGSPVFANTVKKSAMPPFVIQIFVPFKT